MSAQVVYIVYRPDGSMYDEFSTREQAKKFIETKNHDIPSWHYDELWKMGAAVKPAGNHP